MKNSSSLIISIIALLVAIIALIFIIAKKPKTAQQTTSNAKANLSIAYVKLDTLLNHYDLYNALMIKYMNKEQEYNKQLQSKLMSIQQRSMKVQNDYSKGLITSATLQQKMQQLQNEQQSIQQWFNQKQQELANDQQMITSRVMDSINSAINQLNKDNKYQFIFLRSAMLYGEPGADITDTLISILNSKVNLQQLNNN